VLIRQPCNEVAGYSVMNGTVYGEKLNIALSKLIPEILSVQFLNTACYSDWRLLS